MANNEVNQVHIPGVSDQTQVGLVCAADGAGDQHRSYWSIVEFIIIFFLSFFKSGPKSLKIFNKT